MRKKFRPTQVTTGPDYLERMAVVGEMFAEAAHEINNLMGAAAAYAELEMHQAKSGSLANLEKILSQTRLAGEVAINVLHFVSPPAADVGNVEDAIAAAVGLYSYRIRKGLNVGRQGARDLPATTIPTHHLQLALANIIRNAMDAVEQSERPEVRITTKLTARNIVIEIWNSGPHIEPSVLRHLFERFVTTKASGGGTGLGLAIAKRLISNAGGRLTAANKSDGGATFTISIPRAVRRHQEAEPQFAPVAVSGRRILVVDDDDSMREVLPLVLQQIGHLEVEVCGSGDEALRLLSHKRYDAVVLDLRMPGLSGEETYRRMSAGLKRRVVFITGDTIRDTTSSFLRLSHQPALIKPVLSRDLIEAISQVTSPGRRD